MSQSETETWQHHCRSLFLHLFVLGYSLLFLRSFVLAQKYLISPFPILQSQMERPAVIALVFTILLSATVAYGESFSQINGAKIDGEDLLIRQVVSGADDRLLTAEQHFQNFKLKFGKTYATEEEHDYRFRVFKANLLKAKRHQKLDPDAVHGVTRFSDLTESEFRTNFVGLNRLRLPADAQKAPILPTDDLAPDFDWRDQGAVTPVKDQV